MFGRVVLHVVASLAIAQDSSSCFPSCEPLQCTGVYGPREGSQERWTETVKYVKAKVPSAHIDDRIVMAPGRFGYEVTVAADTIERGEILLRLPVETFLLEEDCFPTEAFARLDTGYKSSLKKPFNLTWESLDSNGTADYTQAGLCLLFHRILGNESAFAGYIQQLPPQSSDQTYMFAPMSEMEDLRGTDAYRVATACKRRHEAQLDKSTGEAFTRFREYFPALNWTAEQFRMELQQTLSLCGSRTFNLESRMLAPAKAEPRLFRPALVPLLDMVNHGDLRTRNCQYFFNITGQHFLLQAIRDIPPGEELIQSYGTRSNAELLLFYGFMMEGNLEDFVVVSDFTQGAIDYNFHTRLGHSLACHTPYFRSLQGSGWPPKFRTTIQHASASEEPAYLALGPLEPSVFHSFKAKLQPPVSEKVHQAFVELARHPGTTLSIAQGEFIVSQPKDNTPDAIQINESLRGNLTVDLMWKTDLRPTKCVKSTRPRCEEFAPNVTSVRTILTLLQQGQLPDVARAGGCYAWSQAKRVMYEVKLAGDGSWMAKVTDDLPQSEAPPLQQESDETTHEADLFRDFQFRRYIIGEAGLEAFNTKLFRNGLLLETLHILRIAALPSLSSFAVHGILSGHKLDLEGEKQVARTIMMFCFEELRRRLRVLGVDTGEDFSVLLEQAHAMAKTRVAGNYASLARNGLGIVADFCESVVAWDLPVWGGN